jgi:asparagine synthetase B (glutamine-hydrolysing)
MAWGLEARVPFLDKKFLEVAMNIDAKYKEFNKGSSQETDAEGRPKMEKVSHHPEPLFETITDSLVHHSKSIRLFSRWKSLPTRFYPLATKGAVL